MSLVVFALALFVFEVSLMMAVSDAPIALPIVAWTMPLLVVVC